MNHAIVSLALLVPLLVPLVGGSSYEACGIHKGLKFDRISEFRLAAGDIYSKSDSECPAHVKEAVEELESLATKRNVCAQERADKIRLFHEKYLVHKHHLLPNAARKFFIAYALRVGKVCRIQLIRELIKRSRISVLNEDLRQVDKYINQDGLLALVITEPIHDYNDLIPPQSFLDALARTKRGDPINDEKVYLQTQTVDEIRQIQALCRRKFAPFYEQLVLPLATISSLGYNYKGVRTKDRKYELAEIQEATFKWYRLVFLCESLKNLEVIRLEETKGEVAGKSKLLVRVLNQEDADKLRQTSPELFEFKEQYNYAPMVRMSVHVDIADQLYSFSDDKFVNAVENYRVRPNIVLRSLRKIANVLRDKLKHSMVKYAFSHQGIELGHTKVRNTDEFVRVLDDYVAVTHGKFLPQGGWQHARTVLGRIVAFFFAILFGTAIASFFYGLYSLGK